MMIGIESDVPEAERIIQFKRVESSAKSGFLGRSLPSVASHWIWTGSASTEGLQPAVPMVVYGSTVSDEHKIACYPVY